MTPGNDFSRPQAFSRWRILGLVALLATTTAVLARGDGIFSTSYSNDIDAAMRLNAKKLSEGLPKGETVCVFPVQVVGSASRDDRDVGITQLAATNLKAQGLVTNRTGRFKVEGQIAALPNGKGVAVTTSITDTMGAFPGRTNRVEVTDPEQIPRVVEGILRPAPVPGARQPATELTIDGGRLRPAPDYPYAVGILVKQGPGYVRRPITIRHNSQTRAPYAWVDLREGDVYAVEVVNESQHKAAARVLIDGISRFALSDDLAYRRSSDILGPGEASAVSGYFKDLEKIHEFQVGSYVESVAAELGNPESHPETGVITVAFSAAWIKERLTDEQLAMYAEDARTPRDFSTNATKRGDLRDEKSQVVEEQPGAIRAVLKVRYGKE